MDLHITQQQASLLLPLLQQVAEGRTSQTCSTPGSSSGASNSGSPPLMSPCASNGASYSDFGSGGGYSSGGGGYSSGGGGYSSDDLFQKKERNSKSPAAHSYCHVCCLNM